MPILGHYAPLNRQNLIGVTTEEGVYELSKGYETIFIGLALDEPYGIRGKLEQHLRGELCEGTQEATDFRFEVNARPEHRWEELLLEYYHEHGRLPECNAKSEEFRPAILRSGPKAI